MGTKRTVVLVLILALGFASLASAQSNETIDAILAEEEATAGSAAYTALTAAEMLDDESSPEKAVTMAQEAGWLPEAVGAKSEATFGMLAHLLMQAFEVKGGLMYRIFPGPRYAAREFVSQGWSQVRREPGETISGEFLLRVTGSFLESREVTQ